MEKKNTLLLTVIAIATLLVAVVGATFAYFSTTQSIDATIPVNVTTSTGAAAFTSETNQELTFEVDSTEMQQSLANNTTAEGLQSSASMDVSLVAAVDNEVTTCTYSIEYVWTSNKQNYVDTIDIPESGKCPNGYIIQEGNDDKCVSDYGSFYYYKTPGLVDESEGNPAKEFTIELTGDFHADSAIKTKCDPKTETCTLPVTIGSYPETNIDGSNQKITLVEDQKISSQSADAEEATKITWTATMKWYNRAENQDIQKSKVFEGKIAIGSVTC